VLHFSIIHRHVLYERFPRVTDLPSFSGMNEYMHATMNNKVEIFQKKISWCYDERCKVKNVGGDEVQLSLIFLILIGL
jgi:hypothetical protein